MRLRNVPRRSLEKSSRHRQHPHVGIQAIGLTGPLFGQMVWDGDQDLSGQAQALQFVRGGQHDERFAGADAQIQ